MLVERRDGALAVIVASERETETLGLALADRIVPGTVIGLIGPLGAGKTRLARAIAEALGAPAEAIASPTFVLIHEYPGRMPIYHFDTYRLDDADAFENLGVSEYFEGEGVCLVEWADRVLDLLPRDRWLIRIETEGEERRFVLELPEVILRSLATTLAAADS